MRRILICTVAMAATVAPATAATSPSKAGPYKCVPKNVGYNARGKLVSFELTQSAGGGTARRGDDRYSGKLTVDVKRTNRKGGKGEQTYTVENARLRVRPRSATPKEGDRVKIGGKVTKLAKKCDRSTFTATVTVRKVDVKSAKS